VSRASSSGKCRRRPQPPTTIRRVNLICELGSIGKRDMSSKDINIATKAAIIGGLFALAAAIIGGIFQLASRGDGNNASPAAISSPKAQVSSAPATRRSASSPPPEATPQPIPSGSPPSPTTAPTNVPVLTPTEQSGWILDWHQQVSIESQGIIVTHAGPQAGNGSNFDIQYVPGDGWAASNDTQEMDDWPSTIRPGPATIVGFIMAGAPSSAPQGAIAHIGDTIDWISQSNNVVGYMDVTGLDAGGVEVDMWVWTKI